MTSKASCIVLPIITIATHITLLRSLPRPVSESFSLAMPTVEHPLDEQAVAWISEAADPELMDKDLLEIPLNSLQAEIRQLSAQHGWSVTWFSLLLPQVFKQNCGIDLASMPLPSQVAAANRLSLTLEANLSPEARSALGMEDEMQAMYQRLEAQMRGASVEVRAHLADKAAQRLAAIMPNAQALEVAQHDSFAVAMLHLAILSDVWNQTEPSEPMAGGVVRSSCTVPADNRERHSPLRLALK
ncbi:MAG: hypothetical protein F6K00_32785 [Leptolyngbya sp. SIOISBB]|nr:hypothetical protein [Leptolyngbya sp. SIOISBB]